MVPFRYFPPSCLAVLISEIALLWWVSLGLIRGQLVLSVHVIIGVNVVNWTLPGFR